MSKEMLLSWLKSTEIPLTVISKKTNISRATLYNWINGGDVRNKSYNKVYNSYKDEITIQNSKIKLEGVTNNMEAQYIIDLQKEKIERLEATIAKHKSTPIQSTVWDSLEYDYSVNLSVTFKNFKMGRTILEIGNKERISEVLGYSIQEIDDFWDIGVLYTNFKSHPVDAILSKETRKEIDKQVLSLPNIFEALKDMLGNHYIPMPITYISKDKSLVHSISYNKVDWKNKIVESKVQFLLNN